MARDTPLARRAVNSLSAVSRLIVYNTDVRTAMGMVIATKKGMESANTSTITDQGNPLPTRSGNRRAI